MDFILARILYFAFDFNSNPEFDRKQTGPGATNDPISQTTMFSLLRTPIAPWATYHPDKLLWPGPGVKL